MNSRVFVAIAAALLTGTAIAIQSALTGRAGGAIGAVRTGLLVNSAGGTLSVVVLFLILAVGRTHIPEVTDGGIDGSEVTLPQLARWIAISGILGVVIVGGIAYSVQGVGVAAGLAAVILTQLVVGLFVDRLGGSGQVLQIDARRVIGILLMCGGVWLLLPRNA